MLFDEFFDIVSYCLVFVVGCNIKQYCCLIFVAFLYVTPVTVAFPWLAWEMHVMALHIRWILLKEAMCWILQTLLQFSYAAMASLRLNWVDATTMPSHLSQPSLHGNLCNPPNRGWHWALHVWCHHLRVTMQPLCRFECFIQRQCYICIHLSAQAQPPPPPPPPPPRAAPQLYFAQGWKRPRWNLTRRAHMMSFLS